MTETKPMNAKTPPVFKSEESGYSLWQKRVAIWCLFTEVSKENQALALVASLSGRAETIGMMIPIADLKRQDLKNAQVDWDQLKSQRES